MAYALGLSLGSTHTVAATAPLPAGREAITEPSAPDVTMHSTAHLITSAQPAGSAGTAHGRGRLSLSDAELRYVAARYLARIGDPVPLLGRPELEPGLVAARLVSAAIDAVSEQHGGSPTTVVVAHPGSWQGHRTNSFAAALAAVGLPTVALLSRPVLSTLRYADRTGLDVGQALTTLDIGTRAAECATVRRTALDTFEVVGRVHADPSCGGAAMDDALLAHLLPSPQRTDDLAAWRDGVTAAKEALSSAPEVGIVTEAGAAAVRLTRTELDSVAAPVLQRITELVNRTLADTPDAVAVTLVGGGAMVPAVALTLGDAIAPPVVVDEDPRIGVAAGAVIAAWFLALEDDPRAATDVDTTLVVDDEPANGMQSFLRRRLTSLPASIRLSRPGVLA